MARRFALVIMAAAALALPARAQDGASTRFLEKGSDAALAAAARFYAAVPPVAFTLTLNVALVRGDTADDPPARDASVSFRDARGQTVTLPIKVKTHGRWRLTHCELPPLTLNFAFGKTVGTPFEGLDKARLTSICTDHDAYEQYIVQELQLYRIYQLLTPYSHMARALRVTYVDSATRKTRATRYAFFIEDRDALAQRLNGAWMKAKGAGPSDLQPFHSALFGVFEYFIGNTDFLISELHNASLLGTPAGEIVPVAFDFDYAGAVNTAYAAPNDVLRIKSVRQRLFRGYCTDPAEFQKVFALFNEKRKAIYALYDDPIGKLLRWEIANETKKYFDEFYRVINTPALAKAEILERCLTRG